MAAIRKSSTPPVPKSFKPSDEILAYSAGWRDAASYIEAKCTEIGLDKEWLAGDLFKLLKALQK